MCWNNLTIKKNPHVGHKTWKQFFRTQKETKSCKKTQILIISEKFTNFLMKGIKLIRWDVKYVDSSKKVKIYANLMVWWRSFRPSNQVRCKYVDSSRVKALLKFWWCGGGASDTQVRWDVNMLIVQQEWKFTQTLMVWWRSFRRSNQREKSKGRNGCHAPRKSKLPPPSS